MKTSIRLVLAAVPMIAMAACDAPVFRGGSYSSQEGNFNDLQDAIAEMTPSGGANVTALTGTATFAGWAMIDATTGGTETFYGDATVEADFDANTVSGGIDNIAGETTGLTEDAILVYGSIIGATFQSDLLGTLTVGSTTYLLTGDAAGTFYDDTGTADALSGSGSGDLYDGLTDSGSFSVDIVAER